jgi:hypothetical protein
LESLLPPSPPLEKHQYLPPTIYWVILREDVSARRARLRSGFRRARVEENHLMPGLNLARAFDVCTYALWPCVCFCGVDWRRPQLVSPLAPYTDSHRRPRHGRQQQHVSAVIKAGEEGEKLRREQGYNQSGAVLLRLTAKWMRAPLKVLPKALSAPTDKRPAPFAGAVKPRASAWLFNSRVREHTPIRVRASNY